MTEERLMSDPEYRELKEKYESCKGLEEMFHLIDVSVGWRNDDKIILTDILALVEDPNTPYKAARAAAMWLNEHRDVWSAIAKGDNLVGLHDVKEYLAQMKGQLKEMKEKVRSEIKAEVAPAASAPSGGAGASGAPGSAGGAAGGPAGASSTAESSPESKVPRPSPSTKAGMEGATENLANTADYLQAQMMALAEDASKNPEHASLNASKIAMLQNKFQAITNMMNQLTQMLSNMSKMWSDVAMNSIRNLK